MNKVNPHTSSIGNQNANLIALLAYLGAVIVSFMPGIGFLSWLVPLIIFIIEKNSSFVRFHAMQSLVLMAIGAVIGFLISIVIGGVVGAMMINPYTYASFAGVMGFVGLLGTIVSIIFAVFGVIAMFKAYQYERYQIPIAGKIADRFVK